MAIERDFELLDDYLANRMPGEERIAFEKKLDQDIELKNEYALQQNLVEGLKKARVAELKSMLNNVPVPPVSTPGALATKIVVGSIITAVVSIGLYFIYSGEEKPTPAPITDSVTADGQKPSTEVVTPAQAEEKQVVEHETKQESTQTTPVPQQKAKSAAKKQEAKNIKEDVAADPKIEIFDPSAEQDENSEELDQELISNDLSVPAANSTLMVEVDSNSRKYTFHYKMENDKLVLYGSFEKNLYEILEFISEDKRTAFLYYKQNYYTIKTADKIQALEPIRDPVLLKKLREYRTGK